MNYVLLDTNDNAFEVWYEYSTFHFDLPKKKNMAAMGYSWFFDD